MLFPWTSVAGQGGWFGDDPHKECSLHLSRAQVTVGLTLLRESNAAADLTGDGARRVTRVMGSGCKDRRSFAGWPTAVHRLLCGQVPHWPLTAAWSMAWGLGTLDLVDYCPGVCHGLKIELLFTKHKES